MPCKPSDALFHQPIYNEFSWLETNWFSFTVPKINLRCHIYAGFRTNLNTVMSAVMMWSRDAHSPLDFDHYNARVHLPMPAGNLDAYELANGLKVTMTDPMKEWDIQYRGPDGTAIDLHLTALMKPLMSHDTAVPGGHDFSHFHAVKELAKDSVGHIDQTLQSTGSVRVGGQTFDFDFPSNRDHSWSPRPEYGHGRGNFDEAYFGSDMLFHMQTIEKTAGAQSLTNGYLIDHGELVLFKAGEARVKSADDYRINEIEYEIEDERGRTHVLTGRPLVTSVFPTWPNQYNLAGVVDWTYESEKGLGEYKWHWEVSDMIAAAAKSREKF